MIPAWGILCLVVGALAGPSKRQIHAQALSDVYVWDRAVPNAGTNPVEPVVVPTATKLRTQALTDFPSASAFTIFNVPNIEFQRAIVSVELTYEANVNPRQIGLALGFPSLTDTDAQILYDLSGLDPTAFNNDCQRENGRIINLIFDPLAPIAVTDCVQYDPTGEEAVRVRPFQPNALSFPGAQTLGQQPLSKGDEPWNNNGGWRLLVLNTATSATFNDVTLGSWSIQFEVFCNTRVSNAVGSLGSGNTVGSLGSGIGFSDALTVQCQSGYVATSTSLTCTINGPSANACILGGAGGALITWGLNNDIEGLQFANVAEVRDCLFDGSCIRTTDQLGRSIPVNRFLLYDRLMRYAWLPNGLIVTQVALSDLCTLALDREGRVFMWGRMFPETAVAYDGTTEQQIPGDDRRVAYQIAFPADAVITQIYTGEYSVYAALAAGGGVWMWGYNTAGNLGLPLTTKYTVNPVNVAVPSGARVVQIALSYAVSALVTNTGEVWMWGTNEYFNNGTTYDLAALINANGGNTAGNDPNGDGDGTVGDVGIRTPNLIQSVQSPTPKRVGGAVLPASVVEVALMEYQTVARTKDGALWYWGVKASTYYFSRRHRSLFPNAGTGVKLTDGALPPNTNPGPTEGQFGLNPRTIEADNDALKGDFINIQQRDTTRFYKALSAYGGSIAALTTTSEIYTWGINVYVFWAMYGEAKRWREWTVPTVHGQYLSQVGVLGRNLPTTGTATATDPSLAFWLDDAPGRIATTNRQFIGLAQGGSFGLGLDTTGGVWQWGNQFVDNWFVDNDNNAVAPPDSAQGASGAFANVPQTLPVGDIVTILAAGAFHAAALDLRPLERGCPITKPLMTSQDINFIRGLTNAQRGKFVASTTVTTVCRYDNPNWINHFVNVRHLKQVGTLPLAAVMPPNSNGVTIAFTSLGHGYYAFITTFSPTGTSMAALGITAVESRQIKFIVAVEQMFPDATMFITNPITMQVSVAGLENVYCYDNNFRRGQLLAMPWGVWSYSNNVATVTMQNPSACVGYGDINTDESNEGLLGLLALIALPVICLLCCYVWLFMRYTNTPAVVEAANPMQPVYLLQPAPMIAPSPAVQYMQMPAYIPQASYMAPPYMGY